MFAILKTGGKQYCVKPGDVIKVEKLDHEPSAVISLDEILLTSNDGNTVVGAPFIKEASVSAEILKHVKGKKIVIFKKRRRHNSRRRNGHRQWMTVLKITNVSLAKGE
ncbi:MAG: 50S ribosomal protein L21 [Holosporales bacterium]|jgi:large subunit ribosomal protein L21|nr:50S ribosomal protein L21 [Holosporales bacterium]